MLLNLKHGSNSDDRYYSGDPLAVTHRYNSKFQTLRMLRSLRQLVQ